MIRRRAPRLVWDGATATLSGADDPAYALEQAARADRLACGNFAFRRGTMIEEVRSRLLVTDMVLDHVPRLEIMGLPLRVRHVCGWEGTFATWREARPSYAEPAAGVHVPTRCCPGCGSTIAASSLEEVQAPEGATEEGR